MNDQVYIASHEFDSNDKHKPFGKTYPPYLCSLTNCTIKGGNRSGLTACECLVRCSTDVDKNIHRNE